MFSPIVWGCFVSVGVLVLPSQCTPVPWVFHGGLNGSAVQPAAWVVQSMAWLRALAEMAASSAKPCGFHLSTSAAVTQKTKTGSSPSLGVRSWKAMSWPLSAFRCQKEIKPQRRKLSTVSWTWVACRLSLSCPLWKQTALCAIPVEVAFPFTALL